MTSPARILVVAHRRRRHQSRSSRCDARATRPVNVVLLVPRPYWDPETEEAANVIELAVPLLEQVPGGMFDAAVGNTDPLVAVRQALERSQL